MRESNNIFCFINLQFEDKSLTQSSTLDRFALSSVYTMLFSDIASVLLYYMNCKIHYSNTSLQLQFNIL